jgi:acyl-CoA synthetase (NDP forming)/RimJ/RimL family protein N-acetyltransferase
MAASVGAIKPVVRDVLLRDGSTLRLQAPAPEDYADIKAFYDGLSPESRYFRFHGYGRTDTVARAEAQATGADRLAVIGRHGERVVSAASYDGLREKGVAEVAFAVADEFQRLGIGTRMLEQLAALASTHGIHRFDAVVMGENTQMLGVFENAGFAVQRRGSHGEVTVSLDITPTEATRERIGERDHVGAVAALRPILAPSSIAVVGAAAAPGNVGQAMLANIISGGFQGVVRAVNREGGVVCSMQAVRSLAELPFAPELVIVAASGNELLDVAAEACAQGARALLVVPAGPDDNGGDSLDQQQRLVEILRAAGLRLVGPGSLGVLNTAPDVSVNATFSGATVKRGGLAIGSHAVALGLGLLGHAAARQLGVSTFVSLGNRGDISTSDLLECFEEDDRTAVVMLYVQAFGDPFRFTRVAQRVAREKPILVVKGGHSPDRSPAGARSQTAKALRGDAVFDAVLHQAGVMRFHRGEELFQAAELFESQPLPGGREIGIVSNSPGVAMLIADACQAAGLHVSTASRAANPLALGVGAGPRDYAAAMDELLSDDGIDALVVSYVDHHDGQPEAVLAAISAAATPARKPVVASVVGADGKLPTRHGSSVPNFLFAESCVAALARAADRRAWLSRPLGERPSYPDIDRSAARGVVSSFLERNPAGGWLSLPEAEALLTTHGIPFGASHQCQDVEAAVDATHQINRPVALKADFPAPDHASQIHAVLLGLEGEPAIRSGWRELRRQVQMAGREWNGAIVQELAEPGADVLVGTFRDPDLGSVVGMGLGGRQAGYGESLAFRLPPTTDIEADELIDACDAVRTDLDSFNDTAELNRDALRDLILRFSLLLDALPELTEADLNSIRSTTTGCTVLDMRIRIEEHTPSQPTKTW